MANIQVRCLELGLLPTNTYVVWNDDTKECVLIDPSDGFDEIVQCMEEEKLTPKAVWITHGHDDHIGAVNELKRTYGLLAYIMKDEEEAVISPIYNLSGRMGHPRVVEPDMTFLDRQTIAVLGIEKKDVVSFLMEKGVRGIDRVVDIGDTMGLEFVWDGFQMIESMSRIVYLYLSGN